MNGRVFMEDWDRMVASMKEKIMEGDDTPLEYLESTIKFLRENYHKNPDPAKMWNLVQLRDELRGLKETQETLKSLRGEEEH
jgi:hypothetical protein